MAERDHDAAGGEHADAGTVRVGLGRERDEPDQTGMAVEQAGQPLDVHRAHHRGRVRAGRAAEERAFEVDTEDLGPVGTAASRCAAATRSSASSYRSSGIEQIVAR